MKYLLPSTVEECFEHMGQPQITLNIKHKSEEDIEILEQTFTLIAKMWGYPNLIWKRDETKLYAF